MSSPAACSPSHFLSSSPEHLRFFQYLAVAAKVDACIATAKQALEDGHCVVIGLQSTGEASALKAAKAAGVEDGGGVFKDFVSAPCEGLKKMIGVLVAPEEVQTWLDEVDRLMLPANHLDRLLNELGGPDKVAELSGRKARQVKCVVQGQTKVKYETRRTSNLDEKEAFQSGDKLVAIVSEAASTGTSFGPRRDRIVLPMPCPTLIVPPPSPPGALLGALVVYHSHRRHQPSGGQTRHQPAAPGPHHARAGLVRGQGHSTTRSDASLQSSRRSHLRLSRQRRRRRSPLFRGGRAQVSGALCFLPVIAALASIWVGFFRHRLNSLGALTQGDRRATGSANALGLGNLDIDNK